MVLKPTQQLIVTCRDHVLTNPESRIIQEDLLLCDHKEADSRMILQAHWVLKNTLSIVIRIVDTDDLAWVIAAAVCDNKHLLVSFVWAFTQTIRCFDLGDRHWLRKSISSPIIRSIYGLWYGFIVQIYQKKDSLATMEFIWWCYCSFPRP